MKKAGQPSFNQADFFDRFDAGTTILWVEFIVEKDVFRGVGNGKKDNEQKEKHLALVDKIGLYDGRGVNSIFLNFMPGALGIPVASIRGIKTLDIKDFDAVKLAVRSAYFASEDWTHGPGGNAIKMVNVLRALAAKNSLLLPGLRLPNRK